jgi:hypothetical protein
MGHAKAGSQGTGLWTEFADHWMGAVGLGREPRSWVLWATGPLADVTTTALGEKADLALYEMWLLIPGQPFTKALEDKTSPDFQEHQQQLTTLVKGEREGFKG